MTPTANKEVKTHDEREEERAARWRGEKESQLVKNTTLLLMVVQTRLIDF